MRKLSSLRVSFTFGIAMILLALVFVFSSDVDTGNRFAARGRLWFSRSGASAESVLRKRAAKPKLPAAIRNLAVACFPS